MNSALKRTPLYDYHVAADGKIVPFAGFEMPVQYPTGITAEHRAVRETAGLFDVSHMGEFVVKGPQALELVQHVSVNDAATIDVGQAQYSAMCLEDGGVIDDLLIYRFRDHYMLVVNASNLAKDWPGSKASHGRSSASSKTYRIVPDCSHYRALPRGKSSGRLRASMWIA